MQGLRSSISLIALIATSASLSACVYENEPPRRLRDAPAETSSPPPVSGTTSSGGSSWPSDPGAVGNTSPMLVEVDTNQTMEAVGGDGVGVFVEYAAGGHWHVWWTCDTTRTAQTCDFAVSITAASGALSNIDATDLAGGLYSSSSPSRLETRSTTSVEIHGVRFDTDAGAVITVEAALGDLKDGSFLFFVQDEEVNGGFTGMLTNPLRFQGSSP